MLDKKSAKGDLDGKRTTFILVGLVVGLAAVCVAFELLATSPNTEIMASMDDDGIVVMDEDMMATEQAPPPPQQAQQEQQQVEVLNIVNDMVKINTTFDFSQDFDQNMAIEEYQPIEIITTEVDNTPPVRVAEVLAEFPGGIQEFYKQLRSELKYPESARNANIQGTVLVEFVVERDGSITNPKITYPLFGDCDKEAIRAILALPKWSPAKNANKPVRSYFSVPITFTLQ